MSTQALGLNEEELDFLDTWLSEHNEDLPSLEALDGFLTAMMIAPDYPKTEFWLQYALGANYKIGPEGDRVLSIIMKHWNELAMLLGPAAESSDMDEWVPLVFEAADDIKDEDLDTGYAQHWAFGFHRAVDLLPYTQEALSLGNESPNEKEAEALQLLAPLIMIESGHFPDKADELLSLSQLRSLELEMRDNILKIRSFFATWRKDRQLGTSIRNEAKIGRNDDCPCGSGKKYKKCCAKS